MEFISITLANLLWIIYSMLEGVREGFFDYYQGLNKRKCSFNVKRIFLIQRIIFLLLNTIMMSYLIGITSAIIIAIGQIFMFKYFHKVSYDNCSIKLNSDNSESKDEFNILNKISKYKNHFLVVGVLIQIYTYIFL